MKLIKIETPDGAGEARKTAQGEPWQVGIPAGDFLYYGTASEVVAETRKRFSRWEDAKDAEITFSNVINSNVKS
jgi:hypothetical protein